MSQTDRFIVQYPFSKNLCYGKHTILMEKINILNFSSNSAVDANAESQIASDCSSDWLDVRLFILITYCMQG